MIIVTQGQGVRLAKAKLFFKPQVTVQPPDATTANVGAFLRWRQSIFVFDGLLTRLLTNSSRADVHLSGQILLIELTPYQLISIRRGWAC